MLLYVTPDLLNSDFVMLLCYRRIHPKAAIPFFLITLLLVILFTLHCFLSLSTHAYNVHKGFFNGQVVVCLKIAEK